jgi:hypothetical protein
MKDAGYNIFVVAGFLWVIFYNILLVLLMVKVFIFLNDATGYIGSLEQQPPCNQNCKLKDIVCDSDGGYIK